MTTKPVIKASTKLAKALELHPSVLGYIVSLDPHDFRRLENPIMRQLMSPRISLERIATITGTPIYTLLEQIANLSGATVEYSPVETPSPMSLPVRPDWLVNLESFQTVNLLPLDELLEEDPMPPVMLEVKKLLPSQVLLIRHKWEPQPFYDIWAKMPNLEWFAEQIHADEWHIWVRRT